MKRRITNRTAAITAMAVALVIVIAVVLWPSHEPAKSKPPRAQSTAPKPKSLRLPPLPESPFVNTAQSVAYVGTERCVACHVEQHGSYIRTGHSRSLSRIGSRDDLAEGSADPADVTHALSFHRYHTAFEDGKLKQREELALADERTFPIETYAIEYVVGSGRFAQSYLASVDSYLVESPLTWYSRRNAWGMSPGYDVRDQSSFQRMVSEDCLFCHAGRTERKGENPFHVNVLEATIGCERCHGPGAKHVVEREAGKTPSGAVDHSIVNPKHLPRELAESICQQCHLQSDASVAVRGRGRLQFRPGLPLEALTAVFRQPSDDPEMSVVGHVEQLHLSECWKVSATLTCATCHRLHHDGPDDRSWYRSTCLECHTDADCIEPHSVRVEHNDNDCVDCHMPQVPTEVTHVAFTDHRIGVHPPRSPIDEGSANELVAVQNLAILPPFDEQRCRGLAHAQLAPQSANDQEHTLHVGRARMLLQGVYAEGIRDPEVTAALAELARAAGDVSAARRFAQETLATSLAGAPPRIKALRILGELRFRQGDLPRAADCFRELVNERRNARDAYFLGLCEQRSGHELEAVRAFERSVQIDPLQVGGRSALAKLYARQHHPEHAAEQKTWIKRLTGD